MSRRLDGSSFHVCGPAAAKAKSPKVLFWRSDNNTFFLSYFNTDVIDLAKDCWQVMTAWWSGYKCKLYHSPSWYKLVTHGYTSGCVGNTGVIIECISRETMVGIYNLSISRPLRWMCLSVWERRVMRCYVTPDTVLQNNRRWKWVMNEICVNSWLSIILP